MTERRYDGPSVGAGIFFIAMGVIVLLDRLDVIELRAAYVLPAALIVLGVAIVLGAMGSRRSGERGPGRE